MWDDGPTARWRVRKSGPYSGQTVRRLAVCYVLWWPTLFDPSSGLLPLYRLFKTHDWHILITVFCAFCVIGVFQEIEPTFRHHQISVPVDCAFGADRDMYAVQEQNKFSENPGKWTCGFCGKNFYDEKFLDKHFDVRHSNRIIEVC